MRRFLLAAVLLLAALPCSAQRVNTFYAREFSGSTQGEKISAAQQQCGASLTCVIVIDPDIAAFPAGVVPAKCASCVWLDYRTVNGAPGSPAGWPNAFFYADSAKYTGDICQRITQALADMPATFGTVDARGLSGAQTCTAASVAALNTQWAAKPGAVLLGFTTIDTDAGWIVPAKSQIIGSGRGDANVTATVLRASAAFPNNSTLLTLGPSNATQYFATRAENLTLDCALRVGCTGVYSDGIQEQSGLFRVLIARYTAVGIKLEKTGAQAPNNFLIFDTEVYSGTTTPTGAAIECTECGATGVFDKMTINSSVSPGVQTAGIKFSQATAVGGGIVRNLHCERVADCVQVNGLNAHVSVYATNLNNGSGTTNVLHIASGVNNGAVTAYDISARDGTATNVVLNDVTSTTIVGGGAYTAGQKLLAYTFGGLTGSARSDYYVDTQGRVKLGSIVFANLGTPVNGTEVYCSDCTFANPCAAAGTGAVAKRIAGAWRCD